MASVFDVVEFGARGDGARVNTAGIQAAVDAAAKAGGGRVHVPAGVFVSGTIVLRDRVTLELSPGAVLKGSGRIEDYPSQRAKIGDRHGHHLVYADGATDVGICGGGVIDGNGPAFWETPPGPRSWIPSRNPRVSPLVELRNCTNVRVSDVTIRQSPGWTVHLIACDYVWLRGIKLINPLFGPNTDGFDINGCRDLVMSDCHIECGDDAIVLKTTKDSRSCERIAVSNCVIRTYCAALKLGTESWHDFTDIVFANCIVHHSPRALGVYIFDGGTASNIAMSNVVCDTNSGFILNRPIHLDLRMRGNVETNRASAEVMGDAVGRIGKIRNVSISNFVTRTDGRIILTAADGGRLENIALTGIRMSYPYVEDPAELAPRRALQFSDHSPEAQAARAAVVAENVDGLVLRDLSIHWPRGDEDLSAWGDSEPSENAARVVGREKQGKSVPPMHAVWLKKVNSCVLDVCGVCASAQNVCVVCVSECSGVCQK